jgi:GNAT superfamily N-acetyltransferase
MATITIRDARASDAEALAHLCTQLGYPTTPTVMPARLARLHADQNARAFVAETAGAMAGLTTIHLRSTINHDAPIAQLTLLVVDESRRTQGVGRALVHAVENWAREQGAKRLVVTTALNRAVAHAFYERLGFAHTGRRYAKDFP